uniref:Homeobox domain-containing protein n=1 Tax=Globodera rostochiensis TaxID=31243 RepID=A0A914HT48_GLORO
MLKNANSDSTNSCNDNNIIPLFHPPSPNSNSSIPPFQCQFPAKTPKDEQQLSVAFGGPQICNNGTFPLAERSAAPPEHHTAIEQNLCQRSAHSAAAQMAHAMAQQLAASVYGPNSSAKLDAPHCAQFLPPSSDRLAAPSHCSTSSGINAFLPFGPTAVVQPSSHPSSSYRASELPQPVVPYPVSASTSTSGAPPSLAPIRPNNTIAAQLESSATFFTTAAMMQQQQQQNNASGGSMYHHPNFVQHSPCVVDTSCSSSSTYSTCFNPSNCAPSSAVFFPHMPNEFYGYYHPQCRPFLQHLGAAVVPNNSSTSSSSTSSELEHGGTAAVHVSRWRDSEEERRGLSGQAVTATAAAAIRRAESGTFPGLCPQPRHAVGPGTNNVRVRTKDTYRVVYSECQRLELEREFTTQKFISSERKAALSARLRLTERQIKIWFQNRRAKERRHERRFQTSTINF